MKKQHNETAIDKNYPKGNKYSIEDLCNEEMLKVVELCVPYNDASIEVKLCGLINKQATIAVDQFHTLTCTKASCMFHREQSMPSIWDQPEHIEFTREFIKMMNRLNLPLSDWELIKRKVIELYAISNSYPQAYNFYQHYLT